MYFIPCQVKPRILGLCIGRGHRHAFMFVSWEEKHYCCVVLIGQIDSDCRLY